jgi:hypothetical protein
LPAGQSITINVPLVFWNAARANIATDGANLLPKDDQQGNILPGVINPYGFYYRDPQPGNTGLKFAAINIATAYSGGNGIVMYYRGTNFGKPVDPVDDAQGQLIEWTIRDQKFMTDKLNPYNKANKIPELPPSDIITHINYDVSNVDNLSSPVAMEATQVPVPIQFVQDGKITDINKNITTLQLAGGADGNMKFLLQLMNTQPPGKPKPSWQVYYQNGTNPKIDIGTVTKADQTTGILTVVLNGNGSVPLNLKGQPLSFNFFTNDVTQDYGYTGTKLTYTELQNQLKAFTTSGPNNGLGQYFNGNGWPQYYYPNSSVVRIPGGAFLFADSPLNDVKSSYFPLAVFNMLTSNNGVTRAQYQAHETPVGTYPNPIPAGTTVTFKMGSPLTSADLKAIRQVLVNTKGAKWDIGPVSDPIGVVDNAANIDLGAQTITFKLIKSIPFNSAGYSYDISAPVADPYAVKLRDLWYSWAYYYTQLPQFKNFSSSVTAKSVTGYNDPGPDFDPKDTRIVTFATPQKQLALGMKVTGDGIAASNLVTIEKISADFQTIYLSQAVNPGNNISFKFFAPVVLSTFPDHPGKYPTPPVKLNLINKDGFKDAKFGDYTKIAQEFAASVYETMAVYSTIPNQTFPLLPGSMALVYESIAGGVGHLPVQSQYVKITADLRDLGKSVLRGVPDFFKYPNLYTKDAKWQPGYWNPPPSTPTDGTNYNVFNLDPYVWFVHQKLGLSGYGFSFDDDAADIGANGTSTLSITYNGLNGINNKSEWHVNNKWGPVSSPVTISKNPKDANSVIVAFDKSWQGITAYWEVTANDPKNGVPGSYVTGPSNAGIINNPNAKPPLFTQLTANGDSNQLLKLMGPVPNHTLPYQTVLTFSGTPPITSLFTPSPLPPSNNHLPPNRFLGSGGGSNNTPSFFQDLGSLVVDDILLVIDQIIALTEGADGIVPNPALESAIAALQNALNSNPLDHSLLGQELLILIQLEILSLMKGKG